MSQASADDKDETESIRSYNSYSKEFSKFFPKAPSVHDESFHEADLLREGAEDLMDSDQEGDFGGIGAIGSLTPEEKDDEKEYVDWR